MLSYSIAFKYPFMNYSEYPFLAVQGCDKNFEKKVLNHTVHY